MSERATGAVVPAQLRTEADSRQALSTIRAQGIRILSEPSKRAPALPGDVSSLHEEDLMEMFTELTSWVDFLAVQVAASQIDERSAERELSTAEAVELMSSQVKEPVTKAKARISLLPHIQALQDSLDERYAYRKCIEVIAENVQRDAALLSRELTRRTSGSTPIKRGRNWSA